jgi:flagellin-like hook-associated protein FlgL
MNIVPLQIARVSMQMSGSLLTGSLQGSQLELLKVQQQLSTQKRLSRASDDPAAAIGIERLKRQMAANVQGTSNLNFAGSFLAQADATLGTVTDLVTQANSIASSQVGSLTSASERAAQAQVVNSMLTQLMTLANTKYQGQAVFGGAATEGDAFVAAGAGYRYVGSSSPQGILTSDGTTLDYTVDGGQVFGGLSSQVSSYRPLSPALTAGTRLADLSGARSAGIAGGSVNVTIGATTVAVDLSGAATAGDVVNLLNAALTGAGSDATVGTAGGAFVVNGDSTSSVSIADSGTGTMAADLGLTGTVAAAGTLTGAAVGAKVTATTPLASLNGGAGIDPSGIVISNGGNTATVTLAGLTTVGDLINKINGAGVNVRAQLNAAGTGIDLVNPVSGSPMSVGENGGTTADDLGVRSFNATTKIGDLNGGTGIATSGLQGPTGQIVVTRTDGTTFNVTVDGIKTPSQLIAAINGASGNTTVTAAMNATGNGITLTDTTVGAGNLTVTGGTNFASNGSVLGIFQTGTGGTLAGGNMTMSTDDFRVTRRDGTSFTVDVAGASTVQDVLNAINNADGNANPLTKVTAALNANGNGISLTDASTGGGSLTVAGLNGSTAAAGLGISGSAGGAVLSGTDVNPITPTGLFSSLTLLRDSLLKNDTAGIQQAATMLSADGARVTAARGVVGAREQSIESRKTAAADENTALKSALSLLQDTDMTAAITQFQQLQTSYEAALQTSQKTRNLSLLDFLS